MKINAKLGGGNVALPKGSIPDLLTPPDTANATGCMLVGVDVSHPAPGAAGEERDSIAAFVATVDGMLHGSLEQHQTRTVWFTQRKSRQEVMDKEQTRDAFVKLILQFFIHNSRFPARIIVFRDGVSDGQFDAVLVHEVAALKEAVGVVAALRADTDALAGWVPETAYVIAKKRHGLRMHPTDPREAIQKGPGKGNAKPGSVIDRDIVHAWRADFYMLTHEGRLGTSRPGYYNVLHSDIRGATLEMFQRLVYTLCHVYQRATCPVSIVSVAYYAHLAAARARLLLMHMDETGEGSGSGATTGAAAGVDGGVPPKTIPLHEVSATRMFFA